MMTRSLIYVGKLHVVKVPTTAPALFPYSHYRDMHSAGPLVEVWCDDTADVFSLRVSALAKLKPNVQSSPKLRIDIYAPPSTGLDIANQVLRYSNRAGIAAKQAGVDPETARQGPQTLPIISGTYKVPITRIHGSCAGYVFSEADTMYYDREEPAPEHVEMVGPEMHLGIPMQSLGGARNERLMVEHVVPEGEVRVAGENNPVTFAPLSVLIILSGTQAVNFAATVRASMGV